jgi:hypothetical protein
MAFLSHITYITAEFLYRRGIIGAGPVVTAVQFAERHNNGIWSFRGR